MHIDHPVAGPLLNHILCVAIGMRADLCFRLLCNSEEQFCRCGKIVKAKTGQSLFSCASRWILRMYQQHKPCTCKDVENVASGKHDFY